MLLDSDKDLYAQDIAQASNGIPSSSFSFGDVLSSAWKDVILPGTQVYGQIQIAKAQASAQEKLNQLKLQNATLGSNQPAAAQKVADKTLIEKWLPTSNADGSPSMLPWLLGGFLLLLGLLVLRRLLK